MEETTTDKSKFLAYGKTGDNLMFVPIDIRKKMAEIWSEPRIRPKSDRVTYRFINYLDETGLLPDNRNGDDSGWRRFSIRDCIYIELVSALRDFNVKAEQIRPIFELFSQPYNGEEDAKDTRSDWLDIMLAVSYGDEVELIIKKDSTPVFCDPLAMLIYGAQATTGTLRISMSCIINKFRKANNLKEIEIKRSFATGDLSGPETKAVLDIRNMEQDDILTLKKTKKGLLSTLEGDVDIDEATVEKINSIIPEEYASISAIKRDKEVVKVKTSTTNLYKD